MIQSRVDRPMRAYQPAILSPERYRHYVDGFNAADEELYVQSIPNERAWDFLRDNVPLFECPDEDIQRTYYFRWWTYRKHIRHTEDGFVVTEFLPEVPWAGKHNTINLSAAMHIYEGRWLCDPTYVDDYATFWYRKGGSLRSYTTWLADAILAKLKVSGDVAFGVDLLPEMAANFRAWQRGWVSRYGDAAYRIGQRENGLFFQLDDREGTEITISGHGLRPFTSSAMFGEAEAIGSLAALAGDAGLAEQFKAEAGRIRAAVLQRLWNPALEFFVTLGEDEHTPVLVRELNGYTPWYFGLADAGKEAAWAALMDSRGFYAPYGPTFAEQRHPGFRLSYEGHECQWNGPSWPMTTSLTLTALANLLNDYEQAVITRRDYVDLLMIYTRSHTLTHADGRVTPWIDENLNPYTGDWISRTRLKTWADGAWSQEKGGRERGKDYNHSTYCDLIISGLVGLRPRLDGQIEVNPLIPEDWDYFCLDRVPYHGKAVTVAWDRKGDRYGMGAGLFILADGKLLARQTAVEKVLVDGATPLR